ncbi:hypothetical protein CHU98_g7156 [Xylaria longipes]|nr:hypothetical protein CHU98_g7156 [Xylaria longipes]
MTNSANSVASEESKAKPRRGNSRGGGGRGQNRPQYRSFEHDIQGALPGWYKPPDWDVKPARHGWKAEK